MSQIDPRAILAMGGMNGMNQRPILSEADRQNIARVEGMQVRTQAVNLAVILHQHRTTSDPRLMKTCKVIEEYIREGTFNGDPLSSI